MLSLRRAPITFADVVLLHDYTQLSEITASMDVHKMNSYFGSEIALYFAWVRYYTKYLWIAAVVGLPLFLLQLWTGEVDSPYSGFFSIFIAFWGTCFLEFWKRENSTLAFTWGVHEVEKDEQERETVKVWSQLLLLSRSVAASGQLFVIHPTLQRAARVIQGGAGAALEIRCHDPLGVVLDRLRAARHALLHLAARQRGGHLRRLLAAVLAHGDLLDRPARVCLRVRKAGRGAHQV